MQKRKFVVFLALAVAVALFGGALAAGQAFSPSVSWWTVDGGGGQSAAGSYTLAGTIGQPDAGPVMSGGAFSLAGGYWGGAAGPASPGVFLPLLLR